MFTILDLPNELLDQIIAVVPPSDLEAFARSNKTLYTHSRSALDVHFTRRREYSALSWNYSAPLGEYAGTLGVEPPCEQPIDCRYAKLLLGGLLEKPDLIYYPTSLSIGHREDGSYVNADGEEGIDREIVERAKHIHANYTKQFTLMVDSCDLIEADLKVVLGDAICIPNDYHNHMAATCLLMTMLPNLVSVALSGRPDEDCGLHNIVCQIALANRDPRSPYHMMALKLLREYSMEPDGDMDGEDVNCYSPFAMLPSMRSLRGYGVYGRKFEWPKGFQPGSSMVTSIEIKRSGIGTRAFNKMLSGIAALKKFTYQYEATGNVEYVVTFEPVRLIGALRQHACHSLESLDMMEYKDEHTPGLEGKEIGSLRHFARLKIIRLERLLFKRSYSTAWVERSALTSQDGLFQNGDGAGSERHVPRRVLNALPASAEHLTLIRLVTVGRTMFHQEAKSDLKATEWPKMRWSTDDQWAMRKNPPSRRWY